MDAEVNLINEAVTWESRRKFVVLPLEVDISHLIMIMLTLFTCNSEFKFPMESLQDFGDPPLLLILPAGVNRSSVRIGIGQVVC